MREWLPKDFTPPEGLAEKFARTAVNRGKARERNERIVLSFCSFLFVGILSFMAVQNFHEVVPSQSRHSESTLTAMANAESPDILTASRTAPGSPAGGREILHKQSPGEELRMTPPTSALKSLPTEALNFHKVDHSVEISWEGEGKYAVYKCETPTFSACSIVKVVEGNKYLDKDENSGKITYYRIEPLERKG